MLTKKKIKELIEPMFKDCNPAIVSTDGFSVSISIWSGMYLEGSMIELIKILTIITGHTFFKCSYDVWRDVGYYDSTDDIKMEIIIDKDKIKEFLKKS